MKHIRECHHLGNVLFILMSALVIFIMKVKIFIIPPSPMVATVFCTPLECKRLECSGWGKRISPLPIVPSPGAWLRDFLCVRNVWTQYNHNKDIYTAIFYCDALKEKN